VLLKLVINKSMLTLGRVINALVDKTFHIPYRYVEDSDARNSCVLITKGNRN
jgi:hypothetical protein